MDRISFINKIDGITSPELISQFFDQFMALETMMEDNCTISVVGNTDKYIEFQVNFPDKRSAGLIIQNILRPEKVINMYNRPISINVEVLAETSIKIRLE